MAGGAICVVAREDMLPRQAPDTRVTSYDGVICHRGGERHSDPGMGSGGRSVFHRPPLQARAYSFDLQETVAGLSFLCIHHC